MGYLLIDNEKATNSSVSTNALSTVFTEKATTTTTTTDACKTQSKLKNVSMFVSQPADMDILCGQDKTFTQHPGNKLYRSVIATWSEKYGQAVNKQSKMRMTTEICNYMKKKYNSRFLKPTPMFMEDTGSESDVSNLFAFRWQVLTDQASRDKISHALRTSVKRQERRQKMKAAKEENQNTHKQQSTHSKNQRDQPHTKLDVDEFWMTSPQSLHDSMQSFASIPDTPPESLYGDSCLIDLYKYDSLTMSSQVSFDSSTDMNSLSSQIFVDDSDAHWDELQNVEPLPLSSGIGFEFSNEVAASLSQLLFDDSN